MLVFEETDIGMSYQVDWMYFVAFAAVAVGLVVYSAYVFYFTYVTKQVKMGLGRFGSSWPQTVLLF